jgi:hypothetical protein
MRRVTKSGGSVAAAVWDYAGQMTLLRRFWDSVTELDPSAADLDEGRSMRYCTPEELEVLWTSAGLKKVGISEVVVTGRLRRIRGPLGTARVWSRSVRRVRSLTAARPASEAQS